MKLTTTDYALLGLLGLRPMSGYELKQASQSSIGYFWSESYGQIYPALGRLATAGCIAEVKKTVKGAKSQAGRERRVFSLTARGREALADWLPLPAKRQVPRDEMLLKLFCGAHAPLKASREHLRQLERDETARLAEYAAMERQFAKSESDQTPFWRITLRRGILESRATLAWCGESLALLDDLKKDRKKAKGK
jgi:DNA-binding PadR family transcriptional regulator